MWGGGLSRGVKISLTLVCLPLVATKRSACTIANTESGGSVAPPAAGTMLQHLGSEERVKANRKRKHRPTNTDSWWQMNLVFDISKTHRGISVKQNVRA